MRAAWTAFHSIAPHLEKNSTTTVMTLYAQLRPDDVERHGITLQSREEIEADMAATLGDERLGAAVRQIFGDEAPLETFEEAVAAARPEQETESTEIP